jgi:hypothetical protein
MKIKALMLGTAACALLAAPAMAQDTSTATPPKHRHHADSVQERLDRMERLIEEQQAEIRELKGEHGMSGGAASGGATGNATPAAEPGVSAAQFEALQNQMYETQAEVKAATTPKDKKIHMKGVTVTFGGFAAAESVYRTHGEEADIGSSFSALPFAGPGGAGSSSATNGQMAEFRMSGRQSRISGLAEGNFDADTKFSYYGEFDFLGAAASANSNESNSYTPRIRNLYGTVNWTDLGLEFLYGQSWSLVTLTGSGMSERSELAPPTIDAQYVPGFDWTRQPQLRLVKQFGDEFWIGGSVENPQSTIGGSAPSDLALLDVNTGTCNNGGNGTAGAEFNPCIKLSFNHVPDLVGKVAWEPNLIGAGNIHLEAFGIYRDFYDESAVGAAITSTNVQQNDTSGGGFGGAALVKVVPGLLDVQADIMTGRGIGRYGSGQLSDVTYNIDGSLHPLNETMWMGGATLHAGSSLDLYVYGGDEQESSYFGQKNAAGAADSWGYGNYEYDNTACFSLTAPGKCTGNARSVWQVTPGLWWTPYVGDFGKFKIGLQYSHTELDAFRGLNTLSKTGYGSPTAKDDMIFTSFRYYPF